MKKAAVVVFARLPRRGRVKTRLIPALGATAALRLHEACLQSTARLVAGLPAGIEKRIYFTGTQPAATRAARRLRFPSALTVRTQRGRTLGGRLRRALTELLARGHECVVFLGSDSPTVPRARILQALRALRRAEVVIGPARDGGYYLIGARTVLPEMFDGIAWGTSRTFAQTRARLRRARRKLALLPPWYDVDRPADVARLRAAVRRSRAPHLKPLRAWFRASKNMHI